MFRLTREVRFAINAAEDEQLESAPANSFGGYPALTGAGQFFALLVTVAAEPDPQTSYLLNIKHIDDVVRRRAIPMIARRLECDGFGGGAGVLLELFHELKSAWPGAVLDTLRLCMSPYFALEVRSSEHPMVRLSQTFEFSAAHRLHNPTLSEEQNRAAFGKCNNPHGHGHNYQLQVTVTGKPDANGLLINVPDFQRIVSQTIIERFDHKNLNVQVQEFHELIPSVENIAMVIYRLLEPKLRSDHARLATVTVWESPRTFCEYSE